MMDIEQSNDALARAISLVGSQEVFAKRMNVKQQTVSKWLKRGLVPAERIVDAELATEGKIPRQEFRPFLYTPTGHNQ